MCIRRCSTTHGQVRISILAIALAGCGARTGLLVATDGSMPSCDDDQGIDTTDGGFDPEGAPCSSFEARTNATSHVFASKSMRTTRLRSDVHIDAPSWEPTPSIIEEWTSHPIATPHGRWIIAGDASGTRRWIVDNFILLEVFDCNGSRLSAAFVGFKDGPVTLDGKPLLQLGENAFEFEAGVIDIAPILPTDRPFRLRATALDYGGGVQLTDVYLVVSN